MATGIALGLPTYWALTRRVRPTVHANLHRFVNTEKDIRQWMEQQLVLAAEMVSFNLQVPPPSSRAFSQSLVLLPYTRVQIGIMLFAFMDTVGCFWAHEDYHELMPGPCIPTVTYSLAFGNVLLNLMITKLVFIVCIADGRRLVSPIIAPPLTQPLPPACYRHSHRHHRPPPSPPATVIRRHRHYRPPLCPLTLAGFGPGGSRSPFGNGRADRA